MERVQMTTLDGHVLTGDLLPAAGTDARGVVVVCHPHPQFGGDRFHPVVTALWQAYAAAGFHALRFDFRAAHGGGVDERLDVVSALDLLAARHPGLPATLAGYSFGAGVAISVRDPRVVRVIAVAPPLRMMPVEPPDVPVLVLVPAHDQFCPPDVAGPIVEAWPDAELATIASADHFMAGRAASAAAEAVAWSVTSRPPSSTRT